MNFVFLQFSIVFAISNMGLNLASVNAPNFSTFYQISIFLSAAVPFIYIIIVILHWIYKHRRFGFGIVQRLRAWRRGYSEIITNSDLGESYPRANLASIVQSN